MGAGDRALRVGVRDDRDRQRRDRADGRRDRDSSTWPRCGRRSTRDGRPRTGGRLPEPARRGDRRLDPDPTTPAPGPGDVDPNEPAFTVRVQATDAQGNVGELPQDAVRLRGRHAAPGLVATARRGPERLRRGRRAAARPRSGCTTSTATTASRSSRRTSTGSSTSSTTTAPRWRSFNDGQPVTTRGTSTSSGSARLRRGRSPERGAARPRDRRHRRRPRARDRRPAGERVYAWEADGDRVQGFPVRIDLSSRRSRRAATSTTSSRASSPARRSATSTTTAISRSRSPALDQQLYVWRGDGSPMPDFPALPARSARRLADSLLLRLRVRRVDQHALDRRHRRRRQRRHRRSPPTSSTTTRALPASRRRSAG